MLRKVIITLTIAATLFSLFSFSVGAFKLNQTEASVEAYYLLDLKNDLIMAESNVNKIISPASSAKIMTACIVLESTLDLNSEIEITQKMISNVSGRNMELAIGDRITANDLMYAMLCGGFNDAAIALALSISPSLYEFVELMNEKAQSIGMSSTRYVNVTGVEAASAKTTVGDISILAKYMRLNEKFVQICSTKFYRFSEGATSKYKSVNNRSALLNSYKGIANFNTGSSSSGNCSIIYYKSNDYELISIVMNTSALDEKDVSNYAEIYTQQLLSHAMNDYETITVKRAKEIIISLPVKYSISSNKIPLYLKEDVNLFLSKDVDVNSDLTYDIQIYNNELKAPIKVGDEVGVLNIYHNGVLLSSTVILSKETVERNSFLFVMDMMKTFITSVWFFIILTSFLICVLLIRSRKKRKFRKKKRRRKINRKIRKNNSKTP